MHLPESPLSPNAAKVVSIWSRPAQRARAREPLAAPAAPVRTIAVASGKGGVGKTCITVNLALAFARRGRRVLLIDADLGLANIDTILGLHPRATLRQVLAGECGVADVLVGGRNSGLPVQARASDLVARYGGEEFLMVLPETGFEGALIKAERVRAKIAEFAFDQADTQPGGIVSASIGVATFPEHGTEKQALIDAADRELYRAKRDGRNRVCAPGRE